MKIGSLVRAYPFHSYGIGTDGSRDELAFGVVHSHNLSRIQNKAKQESEDQHGTLHAPGGPIRDVRIDLPAP